MKSIMKVRSNVPSVVGCVNSSSTADGIYIDRMAPNYCYQVLVRKILGAGYVHLLTSQVLPCLASLRTPDIFGC